MPRMLDMIRNSQVPSNLMQSAARGALSVSPGETIEILVHLAAHHKLFGEEARLTLAGWDEQASLAAAADPKTSVEVLGYFLSLENLRPVLLPALAENPSVGDVPLSEVATLGGRSVVEALLKSQRVIGSRRLLQALQANAHLHSNEVAEIEKMLTALKTSPHAERAADETNAAEEVIEFTVTKYLEENAAELAVEPNKPFQPIGISLEEEAREAVPEMPPANSAMGAATGTATTTAATVPSGTTAAKTATAAAGKPAAAAAAAKARKAHLGEERRDSTLQKIAKLDIRGRIALAMRGNKEDRSILIRDSTKLVSLAVLDSPKVSDAEVEAFALQKNVLEAVLRAIPMKRKYAKNYNIMRNLVHNPRTPLDLSLGLMKGLLIHDLKNLSSNKEVSDTIRKVALRMFRQKKEKKG
jgi:hypothetical protein